MSERADVAVVGAGAAGLMAGIQAAREARRAGSALRVVALDGAKTLGAKILVSGGGRCNVTHDHVDEWAFFGSSPRAVRKVLLRFDVPATVRFFAELGVELRREATGKLFPVSDSARTVLSALLRAARDAGVELHHPWRVLSIARSGDGFSLRPESGGTDLLARRVILATGGMSLPKSGSDGHGYRLARSLGHSVTPQLLPALVPLTLPEGHFLRGLPGVALPAEVDVRTGTGRRIAGFTDAFLCTHFGLSGPAVLDVSRHYLGSRAGDPGTGLRVNFLPGETVASIERLLAAPGARSPLGRLRDRMPERLARALVEAAGIEPGAPGHRLTREDRRRLAGMVAGLDVPIAGDRGFRYAEVTAGGVPLTEIKLERMESRAAPGLHLCGEICDVDGRIGGYNFQWAWASGYVAGVAAARA